jgi:hypothetical protein
MATASRPKPAQTAVSGPVMASNGHKPASSPLFAVRSSSSTNNNNNKPADQQKKNGSQPFS